MRNFMRTGIIAVGVAAALSATTVSANGFWSFDEQWWKQALVKSQQQRPDAFVSTARTSGLRSAYSFLEDYSPL